MCYSRRERDQGILEFCVSGRGEDELDRVVGREKVDGRRDRRGERVKGEIGGSETKPKEEEEA